MKKFLLLIAVVLLVLAGAAFWLAGKAVSDRPDDGEVRIEVENVL
ncbi:MAG: hypothetical protein AAGH87_03490 [Pseudomonadota bacterium]